MTSPPLLEFRQVSKVYGHGEAAIRALDRVDLRIDTHEFVAIMGPIGFRKVDGDEHPRLPRRAERR